MRKIEDECIRDVLLLVGIIILGIAFFELRWSGEEYDARYTNTASYVDETLDDVESCSDATESYVYGLYDETFKEIYGEDFDMDHLEIINSDMVSYNGTEVSVDYVEEVATSIMFRN